MSPLLLESQPLAAVAYASALYAAMLGTASVLLRLPSVARAVTLPSGRYGTLDGSRGMLAVGVFVHHSFTAYVFFTHGRWEWSKSALLNHLGQTTVALFFMITGFLFTLKAARSKIDWSNFFLSRFARLFPLYAIVVGVVFVLVFSLTNWELREPIAKIFKELLQWMGFCVLGRPHINAYPESWTVIAGVNWSLRFEFLFYVFGVPLLCLFVRVFNVRALLVCAVTLLATLLVLRSTGEVTRPDAIYLAHFLCGIAAAAAYREPVLLAAMRSPWMRVLSVVALVMLLGQIDGYSNRSVVATLVVFITLVGGMSLFGLFKTRAALWLGDISYGIYLMHGLLLWLLLWMLQKKSLLSNMTMFGWTVWMAAVGTLVVCVATLSYVGVERPIMALAARVGQGRSAKMSAATS